MFIVKSLKYYKNFLYYFIIFITLVWSSLKSSESFLSQTLYCLVLLSLKRLMLQVLSDLLATSGNSSSTPTVLWACFSFSLLVLIHISCFWFHSDVAWNTSTLLLCLLDQAWCSCTQTREIMCGDREASTRSSQRSVTVKLLTTEVPWYATLDTHNSLCEAPK